MLLISNDFFAFIVLTSYLSDVIWKPNIISIRLQSIQFLEWGVLKVMYILRAWYTFFENVWIYNSVVY